MKIIAFTGKKQHGKSTAVAYMKQKFPNCTRLNFKDALIAEIKERFPEVLEEMVRVYERMDYNGMDPWSVDRLFMDKPPLMRALMRNFGTEVRRKDNPNYWTKLWSKGLEVAKKSGVEYVLVDDVRFLNEAQAVLGEGGIIIRIVKNGESPDGDLHASEAEMDSIEVEFTIENDFEDITKLHYQLDAIFNPGTSSGPVSYGGLSSTV